MLLAYTIWQEACMGCFFFHLISRRVASCYPCFIPHYLQNRIERRGNQLNKAVILTDYLNNCHKLAVQCLPDYSSGEIARYEAINRLRAQMCLEFETNGLSPRLRAMNETFDRYCRHYIPNSNRFYDYNEKAFFTAVVMQIDKNMTLEDIQTVMLKTAKMHPPREYRCNLISEFFATRV